MRPQKPHPVEVDQMRRRVGNPDFGFPRNLGKVARSKSSSKALIT
jgi:hypothetical protein